MSTECGRRMITTDNRAVIEFETKAKVLVADRGGNNVYYVASVVTWVVDKRGNTRVDRIEPTSDQKMEVDEG